MTGEELSVGRRCSVVFQFKSMLASVLHADGCISTADVTLHFGSVGFKIYLLFNKTEDPDFS